MQDWPACSSCSSGLLLQIPGKCRFIEFGSSRTSPVSIIAHAVIFFCFAAAFLVAIGMHIDLGS